MTVLEQFLSERVHRVPGAMISFAEIYNAFVRWCSPKESYSFTKIRFSRELREYYVVGAYGSGYRRMIGNCSLKPASALPCVWVQHGSSLVKRRTKQAGNLRLQDLLPILNRLRDKSPEHIAFVLNERGKRNWRGNPFHESHIKKLLETTI